MDTIWLPDLKDRTGPRYMAIADLLGKAITRGELRPGDRLPPQRELADLLGLTLGTVTRAYAEARRRGLVQGEVGRGTYVLACDDRWDPLLHPGRDPDRLVDMGPNLPLHAEDPDLAGALRKAVRGRDLERLTRYQPLTGSHAHRRAGAEWLARHGVDAHPEEIVVTAGAQHAALILMGSLGRRGAAVLCEELTYTGVKTAATLLGLNLAPVRMDGDGIVPADLERAAVETRAGLLYTMTTLHNPTTTTMSAGRRREIAEICRRHDLRIVEDDVHRLLQPDAPPPIRTIAPERTFYVASTSKLIAGGLRVAYVAAPAAHVERLAFAIAASVWSMPALMAEIAGQWISDGTADRIINRRREESAARQTLAREILPPGTYRTADQSYFLWLELPEPWTGDTFTAAAHEAGAGVVSGRAFAPGRSAGVRAVRVSLSAPRDRGELDRGLRIVADLMRSESYTPRPTL